MPEGPDDQLRDLPAAACYELHVHGQLVARLDYRLSPGHLALTHAETAPAHLGRGHAGRLTRFALDDARSRGLLVFPVCPYVADWIHRHPDYGDLVGGPPTATPPTDGLRPDRA